MNLSENNDNILFSTKLSDELKLNGVIKGEKLINKEEINIIKSEINPFFRSVKKISNYSDRILRKNRTVFEVSDLCAVSESAASLVLKNEIIDTVKDYFGEEIRTGQFRYLRQIKPDKNKLLSHCDGSKAVLLMLSLNGQDNSNGPTFFFKESHKLRNKIKKLFIGQNLYEKYKSKMNLYIADDLEPGDYLLFDVRTWHGRLPPKDPGREVVWVSFYPLSNESETLDYLFKHSSLARLTDKQKDVLGINSKCINNQKNLEIQYLEGYKSPHNLGYLGRLTDYFFIKISNKFSSLRYLFSYLKNNMNFIRNSRNNKNSLFNQMPCGKDINPDQML